jgi:hypothetical protein
MPKVAMHIVERLIEEDIEDDFDEQEAHAMEDALYDQMLYEDHLADLAYEEEAQKRLDDLEASYWYEDYGYYESEFY